MIKYYTAAVAAIAVVGCSPAEGNEALGNSAESMSGAEAAVVRDGPFGFDMGQPINEVAGVEKLDVPGLYQVKSPPKPHSDFEVVVLEAYPATGICMIRGVGRDLPGDGSGLSIRNKVDNLSKALETKYGEPTKLDRCVANRIKCNPKFWMMTLDDNERIYGYEWQDDSETMKSANIDWLAVGAAASNIQDTYPLLEFHSADKKACEAARNASSADAL